ncbi:MAG: carboxylating nicotinate-nucleotide diphosphorylase [Candidatus Hydrogenedentota bacterium]
MNDQDLRSLMRAALDEDIGREDITTNATVPAEARCEARLVGKQDGVLSGMRPFRLAFELMDADIRDWNSILDGERFQAGDTLATFNGRTRSVLTAERTAMNLIQHLSGIATMTARYVDVLDGLLAQVCDTRKTTPMLRYLEKEAVAHGGGANHRTTLFHGVLIKENHITAAGGIDEAIRKVRGIAPHILRIEVEVRNMDEFAQALASGADVIMLDNMSLAEMREAARRGHGHKVLLEASGNVTLERLRAIGETGVDFISVGAVTHSSPAADMSLLITNV